MKNLYLVAIGILFVISTLQGCVYNVQMEVNPGFSKTTSGTAVPKQAQAVQAERPVWEVGYKWVYDRERPGSSGTRTRRVLREDTFEGIPCFVIKFGKNENYYTKDVLGYIASLRNGKVVSKRTAPQQFLAWPLRLGRQWQNVYTAERVQEGSSNDIDYRITVAKVENVTVPAGTFRSFKMEIRRSYNDELLAERWYSPKVKWWVKIISYVGSGTRPLEYRLKSYSIE